MKPGRLAPGRINIRPLALYTFARLDRFCFSLWSDLYFWHSQIGDSLLELKLFKNGTVSRNVGFAIKFTNDSKRTAIERA